ncbi:MAG: VWA domain-containing protein [Deltaproteobacteria bacterium]|nr:VWA domain-containing protein [Deltaproteobacteria bacterium]
MGLKKWVWIVLGLVLIVSRLQAAEITELRLSQVRQHLPELTVYLHILDENGNAVTDLRDATLTAFVGSEPVPVKEPAPFDPDRGGVAYIFLVDISKSMSPSRFAPIREALTGWVDHLTEKDRAAVMTLGSTVRPVQDFTADKAALKAAVSGLSLTDIENPALSRMDSRK